MAWVTPGRLDERWLPEMFRAEFLELDRLLSNNDAYVRLGDFVGVSTAEVTPQSRVHWRADSLEIKRFYAYTKEESRDFLPDIALPHEALLVTKRWSNQPRIHYWNDSLLLGGGSASPNLWVLTPKDTDSIAWITQELTSEIGQLQLKRAALGSLSSFLTLESLLEIRVRMRPPEELKAISSTLINRIRLEINSSSYKALKRPIILTAETFEERLREFERFLSEDTLFEASSVFYVEPATTNRDSRLFVVRAIGRRSVAFENENSFVFEDSTEAGNEWLRWYWSKLEDGPYRVFNSLVGHEFELPSFLLMRTSLGSLSFLDGNGNSKSAVPPFSIFAESIDHNTLAESLEPTAVAFAKKWLEYNESKGFSSLLRELCVKLNVATEAPGLLAESEKLTAELLNWASNTFRPALAVRVFRHDRVVGAYLLFGDSQLMDATSVYSWLDDMGMAFQEILSPPPKIVEDAARRESLRRLSWLMHQINSPIGKAKRALEDVTAFLANNPSLKQQLVPDENTVRMRMQTRPHEDFGRFTLLSRLEYAIKQIEDVRRVGYQIKQLKRVQGNLPRNSFDLGQLLRELVSSCAESIPSLEVKDCIIESHTVVGNKESLREAIEEVLHNSCRELLEHHAAPPAIVLSAWKDGGRTYFSINDNGLPCDQSLLSDPFEEDASTYASRGRGSGLGLAIVRETFRAHDGECFLEENFDEEGERMPGVTFTACINTNDQ